jgi:hypothetical protein
MPLDPEVYPTSVRSLGFGMCSFWSKVAGLLAPILSTYIDQAFGKLATTAVTSFAFIIGPPIEGSRIRGGPDEPNTGRLFSGAIAAMNLPLETKGRPLTDYVAEAGPGASPPTP